MAEHEKNEIISRLVRIETLLEPLVCLHDKFYQTQGQTSQNTKDIAEIKDNNKWLWRTLAGTIITMLGSLAVNFIK
jgi:hypothetical protein